MIFRTTLIATIAMTSTAFAPSAMKRARPFAVSLKESMDASLENKVEASQGLPSTVAMDGVKEQTVSTTPEAKQVAKPNNTKKSKEGVFSPVVYALQEAFGKDRIKKLKTKIISKHSNIIKDFVETSETAFGEAVLKVLFETVDRNGDGSLDEKELENALQGLGFTWVEQKQVMQIIKRGDKDGNGTIEFSEFKTAAPKALKTNLTKLAKENGSAMGLLVD
eukprot:CAMPEP_0118711898 /NCGR_PEP_ID=MMETSP0800-20121206/24418_1 /TAXON_ID=210618 ORGANISM="Striatella unipunctata, Strain CCMP2910" /NCGR_SAMPLE_ID=MMETSP0800 /ASSEMBLY_ACC=CAM_ASM_000638 /LENGTH=220 /DNA_ID=CAMNT_0006616693 /DNA_START=33 /DNA_END=695 /DNA_ORIENTATION=-